MYRILQKILVGAGVLLLSPQFSAVVLGSSETQSVSRIQSLRERVLPMIPETSIVHKLASDDLYLTKWLEVSSMDVEKAASRILEHLEWRRKEKVDNIDDTDWTFFRNEYPLFTGQHDKSGQPVAELWLTEWDLRRAIVSGLQKKLTQWIIRTVELQQQQLYDTRSQGVNVTNAMLIVDLEGFNLVMHACRQCLRLITSWSETWETQYPNLYSNVMLVNARPTIHSLIVLALQTRMTRHRSTKLLHPYTNDKTTWMPIMNSIIDRSERSIRFGGSLNRDQ